MLPLVQSSAVATCGARPGGVPDDADGAAFALAGDDVKRILAWSTVSQLAYMFAALAVGSALAATGHLLVHGAFKALLFLGAGCLAHAVGSTAISAMGGLRHSMPWTFWSMTASLAALVGLLPTAGFFSKDAVLGAAYESTHSDHRACWPGRYWDAVCWPPCSPPPTPPGCGCWSSSVSLLPDRRHTKRRRRCGGRWRRWCSHAPARSLRAGTALARRRGKAVPLVDRAAHHGAGRAGRRAGAAVWVKGTDPAARLGGVRPLLVRELSVDTGWDRAVVQPVQGASRLVVAGDTDVVDAYVRGTAWSADRMSRLLGEPRPATS
jgi:NADH-quinone oxidoreductase subunit L